MTEVDRRNVIILTTAGAAAGVVTLPLTAKAEPTGWRPIETAPKDGTMILLFCPDYVGEHFKKEVSQCCIWLLGRLRILLAFRPKALWNTEVSINLD